MKIPLNRIVAFLGPYIAVISGGIAAWLVAKLNIIGIPGLGSHEHELANGLTAGGLWLLTAGLTWLGHQKWLTGHQIQLANDGTMSTAAIARGDTSLLPSRLLATPKVDVKIDGKTVAAAANATTTADVVEDHEADAVPDSALPSDEDELAAPPPPPDATIKPDPAP